ncbi:hypothetical protein [Naasia sp. SYSU D00948]|nr:hypothetical protein [Naasia sp. SYSU D00948]
MNQLPKDPFRDKDKPEGPSMTRIAVWLVVGGFGAYLLVTGIIGILSGR